MEFLKARVLLKSFSWYNFWEHFCLLQLKQGSVCCSQRGTPGSPSLMIPGEGHTYISARHSSSTLELVGEGRNVKLPSLCALALMDGAGVGGEPECCVVSAPASEGGRGSPITWWHLPQLLGMRNGSTREREAAFLTPLGQSTASGWPPFPVHKLTECEPTSIWEQMGFI